MDIAGKRLARFHLESPVSREEFIGGDLVSGTSLSKVARLRSSASYKTTVPKGRVTFALSEGYSIDAELRRLVRMVKPKENWKRFEDAIWLLLAESGFSEMNGLERCYVNVGASKEPGIQGSWKEFDVLEKILFST